ncbi:MAG: DUF4340 domain-containing protein [Magnetococcus sp. MYC-9]
MTDTSSVAKGWRVNLSLLLLLIMAVSVLWWLDRRDAQRTQEDKASRAISAIPPQAVVRLQWWRSTHETGKESDSVTIVAQTKGQDGREPMGRWQIVAPEKKRTHDAAVQRLLEILGESYDRKVADNGADAAQFGLDRPTSVLTVDNGAGATLKLSVGRSAPASKKQYLQIGQDGPVVLISAQVVAGLLQNPLDVRDKRLFTLRSAQELQSVRRESAVGSLQLAREKDKGWRLLAPVTDAASENRVEGWLRQLLQANGSGFSPRTAGEAFKEGKPDWTLVVESGTGNKEEVRFQRQEGRVLAWREGEPDALLLDNVAEELDKSAMELVALRPLGNRPAPEKLQVTYQGKTLATAKKEGQWPKPVWSGMEEVLIRDAWRGVPSKTHAEPWLTLIAFHGQEQWVIPFWKEGDAVVLAPPDRPLELELTHYQAKAFEDTLKALFAAE